MRIDPETIKLLKDEPSYRSARPCRATTPRLLRDTVKTLLQDHKVYVTDWIDARMVPVEDGRFRLADYIHYVQEFIRPHRRGKPACDFGAPAYGAGATRPSPLLASAGEKTPKTMTMMGGPIDASAQPDRGEFAGRPTSRSSGSRTM
ncbi:hypothetical protein ACU4GD_12730 [Cupriavidus basilensis]